MSIQSQSSGEQLYRFLRDTGSRLLANMVYTDSPGHQMHELDYFLRKYLAHEIDRGITYYWIHRDSDISRAMIEVFGDRFRNYNLVMVADNDLFDMAAEICRMVPELGVDVGLGHVRNSVIEREGTFISPLNGRLHYIVTNDAVINANRTYYQLRSRTRDVDPWAEAKPAIDGPLADLIGTDGRDRIAAVHLRVHSGNAGFAMSPDMLSASLAFLRDNGYRIVKVGTEPYPREFAAYGVVNYSESPLRCFKNDLAILANADISLINTSGLENVADVMNLPCVSFSNWPLTAVTYSKSTVVVPAVMLDAVRGRSLSFSEQIMFYRSRPEYWESEKAAHYLQGDRFGASLPRSEELLAAVQEALRLGEGDLALTPLQERFKRLDAAGLMAVAESRVSDFFLQRYQHLI